MDAFVQLALIEKAKRVFAPDPGVMLSFPLLAPMGYTVAELTALSAPSTSADYVAAGDFARTVNFLPTDMVATSTERMLWDVYRDVLMRAEVGDGVKGGREAPAADSILYEAGPDGIRVESEEQKSYRRYRDAWIVAREDYAAHKLTGELSDDPAERQRWSDVDEPTLRIVIDAAASAWETLGGRAAIEKAMQDERAAAFRDPEHRWAEWTTAFDPEIDLVTEVTGNQYAPTGFSPLNFADQNGWLTFDLAAAEMRTLVNEAPDMLKRVLADNGGTNIEHVSFEYRSVALVRPWFHSEVLTSGIWRSGDADLQLSDGGDPPTGACPAYASACVFVRNVKVTEQGVSTVNAPQDWRFTLDPTQMTVRRNLRVDPGIAARMALRVAPPVTPEPTVEVAPRAFHVLQLNSFDMVPVQRLRLDARLRAETTVRILATDVDTATPAPVPPLSPPPPPPPPRDEISILAFICKRLPKVPASVPQTPLPATSAPLVSVASKTWTVKKGETLWRIAERSFGDGSRWTEIARLNNITDPTDLAVGQVLRIS
ncbi:LysM peptidoglycan-binding domain-containing protein [Tessaracoccus sp.]